MVEFDNRHGQLDEGPERIDHGVIGFLNRLDDRLRNRIEGRGHRIRTSQEIFDAHTRVADQMDEAAARVQKHPIVGSFINTVRALRGNPSERPGK